MTFCKPNKRGNSKERGGENRTCAFLESLSDRVTNNSSIAAKDA